MSEIRNYILNSNGKSIFCSLFGCKKDSKECVIIFLPLFEERLWSQRIAFHFAKILGETGITVLIWDYFGYGESSGDTEDFTLYDCWEDTSTIVEHLKNIYGITEIFYLGIRTGCGIACHLLEKYRPAISKIMLWAPIFDLKEFIMQALRSTISTQSYVFKKIVANRNTILEELLQNGKCERNGYILNHIDGYRIGKDFYEEIITINNAGLPNVEKLSIFLAEILPPAKENILPMIAKKQKEKFAMYPNLSCELLLDREFWTNSRDYSQVSERLFDKTIKWFKK